MMSVHRGKGAPGDASGRQAPWAAGKGAAAHHVIGAWASRRGIGPVSA
ncbi:hypothetical protein NO263_15190 [Gluconacetobacter entanii]|uniref:Uncharacterized protein n=1 Tax=Gluconacetobacter entanii TaxID=108528 RepID=A0ABT3K925_9PROT|nr:hypothetical protein [Gluconacetobacter entanii]MCE2579887.1 hypothetical protein [Komagataeibacter sp. FNDCR1]MCW4591926.1 hypothetical protein [Gluconacetobacter entanii]MCW4593815.1 hypothetical protein [Gluconacetobacter entanii]NPC89993.1 hypothetical protein [Gluconacetobacter entanii]